ncbi:MAG: DEAD/DEAH box helicase [Rubrivivax sp.]|jgi:superfamily II DNA/RNA helicase|nr:DEAD/DEAH box helicase [Rubrivivax sp.]
MSFDSLGLHPALLQALATAGYTTTTPVQARAIPPALAGRDLMVSSSTGSGKTASFALPALMRVLAARDAGAAAMPQAGAPRRPPRAGERGPRVPPTGPRILVLAPTRELAQQVAKAFSDYGRHVPGLRVATIVGGVPYGAQLRALAGPLDVLIATPGRLMDHMSSGRAVLTSVDTFVLDEADRMLDMGFIDDIHHIAGALPATRQTLMYSATFAGHVGRLAAELLREPQRVEVASHTEAHADIEQRLHWADDLAHKNALLDHILTERSVEQAVVFTSTQQDADRLADRLASMGHAAAALHGGMPQGRRNRVLDGLRRRHLRVLVATDVAARGIDVPTISHVINYGLPMKAEDYVHRIGRTGRAGRSGLAVTLAERRDAGMIQRIQRFTTQRIPAATIQGLEPRRPEPVPPRFEVRPGPGRPSGRPGFGSARPEGANRRGRPSGGKPWGGRA